MSLKEDSGRLVFYYTKSFMALTKNSQFRQKALDARSSRFYQKALSIVKKLLVLSKSSKYCQKVLSFIKKLLILSKSFQYRQKSSQFC